MDRNADGNKDKSHFQKEKLAETTENRRQICGNTTICCTNLLAVRLALTLHHVKVRVRSL